MNAGEIKQLLAARVEDFCVRFLAGGKQEGREWRCADILGNPPSRGKQGSFVVPLSGNYVGTFFENDASAPKQKGSLIDILMEQEQCDFKTALTIAADWLGVQVGGEPSRTNLRPRTTYRPMREPLTENEMPTVAVKVDWKPIDLAGDQARYLMEQRGISEEVITEYRIGEGAFWFPQDRKEHPAFVVPGYAADGEKVLNAKYIADERPDGNKLVKGNKGFAYHLIGMHAAEARRKKQGDIPLVITEGEPDMLTLAMFSEFAVVSVPMGAKADKEDGSENRGNAWIDADWEWLSTWSDIILALDGDKTGRAATQSIARRIGIERVRIAQFPDDSSLKDANSIHLTDPESLPGYLDNARGLDPEYLRRAGDFYEEVWEEFYPSDDTVLGTPMPFDSGDTFPFRIRRGEMTVWQGFNKHGKTTLLNHCLVHFAWKGERCCVASLEVQAKKTLRTMARMAMGQSRPANPNTQEPDRGMFDRCMAWLDERVYIYDKVGAPALSEVLEVWRYAARRYGVRHFVLDSLMKLDLDEEETPSVKKAMNDLFAFAVEYDVHVHLVAHSRKPPEKKPEEKYWPQKYMISGTKSISDIPHNIVCVYRHKAKEIALEQALADYRSTKEADPKSSRLVELNRDIRDLEARHDALFIVQGQREGGDEPIMQLWFDKGSSWQYFRNRDEDPRCYIGRTARDRDPGEQKEMI